MHAELAMKTQGLMEATDAARPGQRGMPRGTSNIFPHSISETGNPEQHAQQIFSSFLVDLSPKIQVPMAAQLIGLSESLTSF